MKYCRKEDDVFCRTVTIKTNTKAKTNTKTKKCNLGMFDDIWIAEDQVPCNVIFHDEEKTADGQFQI